MSFVLDVSNYDAPTFDADCFKANGVDGVIIGCQRENLARQMADKCVAAGLPIIGTYAFLYFGQDTMGQTVTAYKVAADYKARYVCLDVESHPPNEAEGLTPAQRIAELWACVRMVEQGSNGITPVIYTYAPYWRSEMGNTTEFSSYRLWHAHYLDNAGSPFETHSVNYGGWTDLWAHQWTSTLEICGRRRDANHLYEEEDWMTSKEGEDLLLAVFSGAEEAGLPREERLTNARYRMQQGADGAANSVNDRIVSHSVSPHGDANLSDHAHALPEQASETGGIIR